MKKKLQTLRYLTKNSLTGTIIGFIVILCTVAITDLVYYFTVRHNVVPQVVSLTVPFEVTSGIIVLVMGIALFTVTFKVSLANSVSRKSFILANLPADAVTSAIFSLFNLAIVKIHGLFWPINGISEIAYEHITWLGFLSIQFVLYFLMILAGKLISLAFYRSNAIGKLVLSITPVAVIIMLWTLNGTFVGELFRDIINFLIWSFKYPRVVPFVLVYATILYGLLFLLIRRASLKDK